jgi:hypothetical protein
VSAYSGLATIRASCTDSSIRDGAEAVRAATKACELTGWKDSQNLDLLAIAYAESENFPKAVEYEKQALTFGEMTAEDHNRMILRLTLFEHRLKFQDPTIFE